MTMNQTRIDAIYEQLNGYMIELGDPTAFGPRYYIDKIATCRNYLNAVSLVASEVSQQKQITSSVLRREEAAYEVESARLLSTDENVRRMSAIKDRESMVAHILRDRKNRIEQLRDQLLSIDAVSKYVAVRSRELHSTMDAIKNQRRFMQIEVQTGAFYGDERVPQREAGVGMGPAGVTLDFDEASIRRTLDETPAADFAAALEEAATPKEERPAPAPAPAEKSEAQGPTDANLTALFSGSKPAPEPVKEALLDDDAALEAFLGGPTEPAPAPPTVEPSASAPQTKDEDLSYMLDNI